MKTSIILHLVLLRNVASFTPRNKVNHGGVPTPSGMKQIKLAPPLNSDVVANAPKPEYLEDMKIIDVSASLHSNGTASELPRRKSSRRGKLFFNLPIEFSQELTVPQKRIRKVLKEPWIEVVDVFLVLLSSVLVALSTLNTIDLATLATIIRVENVIAFVFAFEFFVRWYSQFTWKGVFKYFLDPFVLVDLVVVILPLIPYVIPHSAEAYNMLPSWLFSSTGMINLRLLRVLRLQRVLKDIDTFSDFQMALGIPKVNVKPYKLQLARVVLSIYTLLSVSTGLIYSTECAVNPNIPDYFTALYFGLTTLTTVGFGDITPITPEGKFVVSATILAGVAVIPAQAAALVDALLAREEGKGRKAARKNSSGVSVKSDVPLSLEATCPSCDARFHWSHAGYCWSCGSKL